MVLSATDMIVQIEGENVRVMQTQGGRLIARICRDDSRFEWSANDLPTLQRRIDINAKPSERLHALSNDEQCAIADAHAAINKATRK